MEPILGQTRCPRPEPEGPLQNRVMSSRGNPELLLCLVSCFGSVPHFRSVLNAEPLEIPRTFSECESGAAFSPQSQNDASG